MQEIINPHSMQAMMRRLKRKAFQYSFLKKDQCVGEFSPLFAEMPLELAQPIPAILQPDRSLQLDFYKNPDKYGRLQYDFFDGKRWWPTQYAQNLDKWGQPEVLPIPVHSTIPPKIGRPLEQIPQPPNDPKEYAALSEDLKNGWYIVDRHPRPKNSVARFFHDKYKLGQVLLRSLQYLKEDAITVQYPDQKRQLPRAFRGKPRLFRHEGIKAAVEPLRKLEGLELCIACGDCADICPTDAISITPQKNDTLRPISIGENYAQEFNLDVEKCINCGLCQEVCPTTAIRLGAEYELAAFSRNDFKLTKKQILE